jgi:hypothetical protein
MKINNENFAHFLELQIFSLLLQWSMYNIYIYIYIYLSSQLKYKAGIGCKKGSSSSLRLWRRFLSKIKSLLVETGEAAWHVRRRSF